MALYYPNAFIDCEAVRVGDKIQEGSKYPDEYLDGRNFVNSLGTREEETKSTPEGSQEFAKIFGSSARFEGRKIRITDVTLREGDQAPLTSFSRDEKLYVYLMLRELGVDTIEVGFPAGDMDFKNIKHLVDFFQDDPNPPYISVLGRSTYDERNRGDKNKDISHDTQRSIEVTRGLKKARIHSFIATSDAHVMDKFGIRKNKETGNEEVYRTLEKGKKFVLESIKYNVGRLKKVQTLRKNKGQELEIEWSPEDATNTRYDFLLKCIRTAITAGANVINVPDTVGISKPEVYKSLFFHLIKDTRDLKEEGYNFRFSSHIHNDKDFASAATLGAVEGGVSDVEATANGLGERTGNSKTHMAQMMFGVDGKANGGFELESKMNHQFTAIFMKAVRRILGDDLLNREAGIGRNTQSDGSGVHQANNKRLYGGGKPYAKFFGVLGAEGYFSARGGKNGLERLADTLGVDLLRLKSKKGGNPITEFIAELSSDAEIARRVYPANILNKILKREGRISEISYDIDNENKKVRVTFTIDKKEICIEGEMDEENGYIGAIIGAIRKYLGKDFNIEHLDYSSREKPSLRGIINDTKRDLDALLKSREEEGNLVSGPSEYFNNKIQQILSLQSEGEEGEKSVAVTHFKFNINGKERNIVTHGHDTQRTIVEAICGALMPEILQVNQSTY